MPSEQPQTGLPTLARYSQRRKNKALRFTVSGRERRLYGDGGEVNCVIPQDRSISDRLATLGGDDGDIVVLFCGTEAPNLVDQ